MSDIAADNLRQTIAELRKSDRDQRSTILALREELADANRKLFIGEAMIATLRERIERQEDDERRRVARLLTRERD